MACCFILFFSLTIYLQLLWISTELQVKAMLMMMMMMIIMPSTHLLMWVRGSCCWIKKILKQNWISMWGLDVLFLVFFQTGGVWSSRESRARGIEGREMACHLGMPRTAAFEVDQNWGRVMRGVGKHCSWPWRIRLSGMKGRWQATGKWSPTQSVSLFMITSFFFFFLMCCSQQDTSSSAFNGAQFSHNFSN